MLLGGIELPLNTNLDNCNIIGNYYQSLSNRVSTFVNCPTKVAFTMKVEYSAGDGFVCQTIREYNTGKQYYRYLDNETRWSPWATPSNKGYKVDGNFEGDCNQITQPGVFDQLVSPVASNSPGYWAYVTVYSKDEYITQVAIGYNENNISMRNNYNGWSTWRHL